MILVGNYDSPFVRRVAVALHHYGFPFQRKVISVFKDFEAMLDINPLGKVPALELDDGGIIVDSRMIIDYLEGLVARESRLISDNPRDRQRILGIEAVALGLAETSVGLRIERYRKNPTAHDPDWLTRMEKQIRSALVWLDKTEPSPWLGGDKFSISDITTVVAYTYLKQKLPELVPPGQYPQLEEFWGRCEVMSVFRAAQYSEAEALASET